ncbi:hypothetical protein bcCo53_001159 (plasmid) [Borrelia coriaceae]|uniref:Uncharacterized protein n=1 Tax=Borrelia coriaceae ATCC 43381 TaxID=1408429 RepID=W5SWQ7_9SPIR|nr:hypothetical protein [Borrelia coriaceae]AHH11133.1 Hypothetical protein BCO_0023600 [Borrelia coriaceae ATCC 43381]UPA16991.1 hypothetical protein bcCo53_001159 [Borrelia coriaceae]
MKHFGVILLFILFVVFIVFYWKQDSKYGADLQENLALSDAQVVLPEEAELAGDELVGDTNLMPQGDGYEIAEEDLSVSLQTKQEAYDKLDLRVKELKSKFLEASFEFIQGKHQFSFPYFERFAKFDGEDKKDIVYASLGYDVNVIKTLETMINKVDPNVPSYLSGLDKGIASNLLDILYNVTYYVREVALNNHLNFFNLDKIKNNDAITVENIVAINVYLETLIKLRENLILKLKQHISLAGSKSDRGAMEVELRKILDLKGDIRLTLGKIMVMTKSIEDLINVQFSNVQSESK